MIFDLDTAFIILWTRSIRETGLPGYIGIVLFIAIINFLLLRRTPPKTDNIDVRYTASIGLLFNFFMIVAAIVAIIMSVPKVKLKSANK